MLRDLSPSNLISISANGVDIASYPEIRNAVIRMYEQTYGSDIDLSTASADGVFVSNISLIINNILESIKTLYANLDVNTASGIYLDSLCRLANVRRRQPTFSSMSVSIQTTEDESYDLVSGTEFVDKAGTIWKYTGEDITLPAYLEGSFTSITLICTKRGNVEAPANWLVGPVENSPLNVVQNNAAIPGRALETDQQLRARRNQSSGAAGVTVLESLSGALLEIDGIEDVLIYNNNSDLSTNDESFSGKKPKDNTAMSAHSIYVILRQASSIEIADEIIGTLIHDKLTPGILTCDSALTDNQNKEYLYEPSLLSIGLLFDTNQVIYWKSAEPVKPQISFTLSALNFFDAESQIPQIVSAVVDYANSLRLSQNLEIDSLYSTIVEADAAFKGNRTYTVAYSTVAIANGSPDYVNGDTFFNYSKTDYHVDQSGNTYLIKIAPTT